jgi:FtsZ-interacting cell division protein YlmF
MLRNVLTYMGLGPDEDYDEGYLSEPDDVDIDLTDNDLTDNDLDDGDLDEPARSSEPRRTANRSSRRTSAASSAVSSGAPRRDERRAAEDPHAQRERPGWLIPPSSPPAPPSSTGRDEIDPVVEPHGDHIAYDAADHEDSNGDATDTDASHDEASYDRQGENDVFGAPLGRRGAHDVIDTERLRPLRAVPPTDEGIEATSVEGAIVPPATVAGATGEAATTVSHEPEIRFVPPRVLTPRSFGDAKELADDFKAVVPVVMDLQSVERDLARRLIDFASGICYALDGSMEKIASQVFLLIPVGVDVSEEERRNLESRGHTDRR